MNVGAARTEHSKFNFESAEVCSKYETDVNETHLAANRSTVPCVGVASTLTSLSSSNALNVEQPDLLNTSEDSLFETVSLELEGNNIIGIENSSCGAISTTLVDHGSKSTDLGTASEISSLVNSKDTAAENRKRVTEFFSHSRLHYISTWCSESKAYVASLQNQVSQ